jgi:ABC-type microcin C transport system permease subunit YejB
LLLELSKYIVPQYGVSSDFSPRDTGNMKIQDLRDVTCQMVNWLSRYQLAEYPTGLESSSTMLLEYLILHAGNTFVHNVDTYSVITQKIPRYMTTGFALTN